MDKTIPFSNDIIFKTKIAEITSISLEHNVDFSDHEISGNFIISGDYKTHEVSVNKEPFNYNLPFSVELPDNVIKDSINFDISDFTYDIIGDETLRVNIEFNVKASLEEKPVEIDAISKEIEDIEVLEDRKNNKIENEVDIKKEEKEEVKEETKDEQVLPETSDNLNREIDENLKEDVISSLNNNEDEEYMTYMIHIVRESDSIESICENLKVTRDVLEQYNDLTKISINDKLIIPINTDE